MGWSWVLLVICVLSVARSSPVQTYEHADELFQAYENVEGIYRDGQPRKPLPSPSSSPSPSFNPSVTSSPSTTPSPSKSPPPFSLPGITRRDVETGRVMSSGTVKDLENRRYPVWWPSGEDVPASGPTQWQLPPNRFKFVREQYAKLIPLSLAPLTITHQEDEEAPTQTLSRPAGDVHRYLGYIPISRKWEGHPYFDRIPQEPIFCNQSRTFNCIPREPDPTPTPTPTETPTPTPTATPTPTPTPIPGPQVDLDQLSGGMSLAPSRKQQVEEEPEATAEEPPPLPPLIDDSFEPPEEDVVPVVEQSEPVEVARTLVMRTVAGGTEAASPYSAGESNMKDPVATTDHNDGQAVSAETVTTASGPSPP